MVHPAQSKSGHAEPMPLDTAIGAANQGDLDFLLLCHGLTQYLFDRLAALGSDLLRR